MKPILLDLQDGRQTKIDEDDLALVEGLTLYAGTNGYVYFSKWENGRSVPRTLHLLLMGTPKGMHTDHINGDKLDNQRSNLRVVTPSKNGHNRKRPNRGSKSGVLGVSLHSCSRWVAQITINRKNHYLGLFDSVEDAAEARRATERNLLHD